MKCFLFLLLLFGFNYPACAFEKKFSGTWQLMSGEYLNSEEKLVQYKELDISSIKVISATHFSFVSMSGSKFWSSGVGEYRFTENEYIESPIHTSYGVTSGKEYIFSYKIEQNIWINSRWENGKRVEYEVWKRLK
jgi:hypothetical protein